MGLPSGISAWDGVPPQCNLASECKWYWKTFLTNTIHAVVSYPDPEVGLVTIQHSAQLCWAIVLGDGTMRNQQNSDYMCVMVMPGERWMEGREAILVSSALHCWLQRVQTRKLYPPIPFLQFVAGAAHHKCFKQYACKPCCLEAWERASSLRHWRWLNDLHGNSCTSNHTFYHVWTTVI